MKIAGGKVRPSKEKCNEKKKQRDKQEKLGGDGIDFLSLESLQGQIGLRRSLLPETSPKQTHLADRIKTPMTCGESIYTT